jgi:hypothetical protein
MKKIFLSIITLFVFVLATAIVSADIDLSINPNSGSMTFSNLEESKTIEFTLTNTGTKNLSVDINLGTTELPIPESTFNFNNTQMNLNIGDSKDIKLEVNLNNIANKENIQNFIGIIPIYVDYEERTNISNKNTKTYQLSLNIPAYSNQLVFSSNELLISELPGETFSKTMTIKNDGTVTVNNIILGFSDEDFVNKYELKVLPTNIVSLTPSQTQTLTISGKVPPNMDFTAETSILKASYETNSIQTTIKIEGKSGLQFNDLEFDVEFPTRHGPSDDDGSFGEGSTIRIAEGSKVIIEGYVENLFNNIELRRPEVTIEIRKMDRFEENYRLDDLESGDDDLFRFEFTIPYDGYRERDSFEVVLYVEAEDRETGQTYKTEIKFNLEIDKEREQVTIVEAFIENEVLSCNRETNLYVTIRNTGEDDLTLKDRNTASLSVRNSALNLNYILYEIEMDADDYDATNEQTFIIPIDASKLNPSTIFQSIRVIAYYDRDEESDEKNILFKVEECTTPTTVAPITTTTTTVAPITTTTTLRQIVSPDAGIIPSEPVKSDNERMYIIFLIALIAVVLIIGGLMIGFLIKK